MTGAIAAAAGRLHYHGHRDHAMPLARGTSARACMAELSGSRLLFAAQGPMHYFDKAHHMYGGHATWRMCRSRPMALPEHRKEDRVLFVFEGAINQGFSGP